MFITCLLSWDSTQHYMLSLLWYSLLNKKEKTLISWGANLQNTQLLQSHVNYHVLLPWLPILVLHWWNQMWISHGSLPIVLHFNVVCHSIDGHIIKGDFSEQVTKGYSFFSIVRTDIILFPQTLRWKYHIVGIFVSA